MTGRCRLRASPDGCERDCCDGSGRAGERAMKGLGRYGSWIAACLSRAKRAPMGPSDVEELARHVEEKQYAGGTTVFRRGEQPAEIHVVRKGRVELTREIRGRAVTLQILNPGDVFGDVPALLGELEPFDARAVEDCTLLSMDSNELLKLLTSRPLVARRWFVSLAERMARLQGRLIDLLAGGIESQLASILLREADDEGVVRLTQTQLAKLLGVQRSSAQRVLKTLETAGLIELRYRRIELVDPAGLLSLLDESGISALTGAVAPGATQA